MKMHMHGADLHRRDRLRVDSRDVDRFQRVRPGAICAMMQESAWRHAESMGFGYFHLAREGRFWVLDEVPPRVFDFTGSVITRRVEAAWSDIDLNGHVNNTRYVDWMLDGFNEDFHRRHLPRRIEMNFVAELRQNEALELNYLENRDKSWLVNGKKPGGESVVRGRLYWHTA
ncbi:MAG TPA: hypothetical protein ENN40_00835 [Candidatus Aminicenantes bacterium]|nr:hypothetical protein [Candidatus Aminicenantes bacterium]